MGHLADTFHLTVDVPVYLVSRPRLWRLLFGMLCVPLGIALLWGEQVAAHWHAMPLGDAHMGGIVFLLVGAFYMVKSVLNDLLHVHRLSFDRHGMHLVWSHVPQLFGKRHQKERLFQWSDLNALLWIENHQEHALAQHLQVEFKEHIGLRKSQIKVLVSDDRNLDYCEKLVTFLPEDFVVPEWLDMARKKKNPSAASQI